MTPEPLSELAAAVQLRRVRSLPRSELLGYVASQPVLSVPAQQELLRHPNARVVELLASRGGLDRGVQLALATRPGPASVLAGNAALDPAVADRLAGLARFELDLALAGNPSVPVPVLSRLWRGGGAGGWVRDALLGNPSLPLEVLGVPSLSDHDQGRLLRLRDLPVEDLAPFRLRNLPRLLLWQRFDPDACSFLLWCAARPGDDVLGDVLPLLEGSSPEARELLAGLCTGWAGTLGELLETASALAARP